ncbi:MAG TPA: glutathione S-transferase family protein [Burkholderiales bacterium]|nr:glutathione S-transferase family protein [Burkholderiales bacterium]
MAITLYDLAGQEDDRRFSPYCWRVKMALKHKGLDFEAVPWRYTEKDAIAFSEQGQVPVLKDGSAVVVDSWKIASYLEEAYPSRPALFEGAQAMALSHFFNTWVFREIHPRVMRSVILDLFSQVHEKDKAYFRETREKRFGMTLEAYGADPAAAIADLRAALEPLRPTLARHDFIGGRGPGYCDYILFGAFQWARAVSPKRLLEPDDPVFTWREHMLDLFGAFAREAKGYPV